MSPSITSQPSEEGGKHQEPPDLTLPESKTQRGQNVVSEETVSTVNQLIMLKKDTSIDAKGVSDVKSEERVLTSTPLQKPELDNNMEAASRKKDYLTRIFSRRPSSGSSSSSIGPFQTFKRKLFKFAKFVGPGFLVSVAYIDPGNYATDVAAGASYRYRLLFVVLLSNIFAIFLQSLCIKLGSVTGMNLAENCKAHLPPWLNYVLYFFAEAAIIATDIAEVIGTAISLNILLKIPLVAGCALAIVDVLIILFFYHPSGMSMKALRTFELFVILLVFGVVICFCYELSKISNTTVGEVFRGYLPSSAIVQSKGLYQSCGILGATVMPHSLYLGSGIVQSRLRDFDTRHSSQDTSMSDSEGDAPKYRPSLSAIRSCLNYSIIELALSLITFALFVNSAILIVSGASLSSLPESQTANADLFSIHNLLSTSIAPVAGTIFALALLLSGTSAGIVCTIAGQMVSEGQLAWSMRPWVRRLVTRAISIVPSIIIAAAVGREGLGKALEGSQVALSIILPITSAPLIYFTWSAKVMAVPVEESEVVTGGDGDRLDDGGEGSGTRVVVLKNSCLTTVFASVVWLVITVMNIALLVLLGTGKS